MDIQRATVEICCNMQHLARAIDRYRDTRYTGYQGYGEIQAGYR